MILFVAFFGAIIIFAKFQLCASGVFMLAIINIQVWYADVVFMSRPIDLRATAVQSLRPRDTLTSGAVLREFSAANPHNDASQKISLSAGSSIASI